MLKAWRSLPLRERVTRFGYGCLSLAVILGLQAGLQFQSVRPAAIAATVAAFGFAIGGILMLTVVRRKLP